MTAMHAAPSTLGGMTQPYGAASLPSVMQALAHQKQALLSSAGLSSDAAQQGAWQMMPPFSSLVGAEGGACAGGALSAMAARLGGGVGNGVRGAVPASFAGAPALGRAGHIACADGGGAHSAIVAALGGVAGSNGVSGAVPASFAGAMARHQLHG